MRNLKDKDLTGKKLWKWTVSHRVPAPPQYKNQNHSYWLFTCECGNQTVIEGGKLRIGNTKSCRSCYMKPFRKEKGECSFNGLYLSYKHGALKRNLDFKLTLEEFRHFTKQNCHYCGTPPIASFKGRTAYGEYIYNGVDRLDSKKGYYLENCVSCCTLCNRAKNNFTVEEFENWIKRLVNFNKEKYE